MPAGAATVLGACVAACLPVVVRTRVRTCGGTCVIACVGRFVCASRGVHMC